MAGFNLPSGSGGLMRFSEEYESKIQMKPEHVIFFVVGVIAFVIALRLFVHLPA
jgi:preprotein translocase subunit Sec61beta